MSAAAIGPVKAMILALDLASSTALRLRFSTMASTADGLRGALLAFAETDRRSHLADGSPRIPLAALRSHSMPPRRKNERLVSRFEAIDAAPVPAAIAGRSQERAELEPVRG